MTKNESMRKSYYARKKMLIELLGGECKECGKAEDLQFDHINPKDKVATITQLLTYRLEAIFKEIKKCQLLCKNCHSEKNKIDNGEAKHGSLAMYRHHRCRCELCKTFWNKKVKIWKLNHKLRSSVTGNTLLSESRDSRIVA